MAKGYLMGQYESFPQNELTTSTLSTKTIYFPLQSATPKLGVTVLDRDDELRNLDEPVAVIPDGYDPQFDISDRAYPDTVSFMWKMALGAPTSTAGNGVITDPDSNAIPTGATKHVWTAPFGPSGINPQTTQLLFAYKDQSFFATQKGAALQQLQISSPEKGGVQIKGSGISLYQSVTSSDPGNTPAYEALTIRPFTRRDLTLTWLGGSGTTSDFTLQADNPVTAVRSLGINSHFPDVMEKGDGLVTFTGTIPKRDLNVTDYNALINNTGFAATARWKSETVIGVTSYNYAMWITMSNCQYVSGDADSLDQRRHHGGTFNWKATNAGSTSVTVTVVNATSSYA